MRLPEPLLRFTRAERWVHRTTSSLVMVCLVTAGFLYLPGLAQLVGRRELVVTVHEWAGLLLPAPYLLGLASRAFRVDLGALNRFVPGDAAWLRRAVRRGGARAATAAHPPGKFNAGQKLYAAFIGGAVLVLLGTGLVMWFPHLTALVWRTGATFVHDWLALAVAAAVAGHVRMAARDPEARCGMRTGRVSGAWARREHPRWLVSQGRAGSAAGEGSGARAGSGNSTPAATLVDAATVVDEGRRPLPREEHR